MDIDDVMKKVDKLQDSVKYRALGKSKTQSKKAGLERKEKDAKGLDDQQKANRHMEIQLQQI